ncbi:hypothetical protein BB561_005193 [Smittium simulii]|uniref:Trimethylguanosine synthase n=1 Tax=Smittium simulii TaxID=133385 RepID=A0A2T9YBL1_9FUNG|nr:hypothetical protein BB561_005193 [Smittium simulii]
MSAQDNAAKVSKVSKAKKRREQRKRKIFELNHDPSTNSHKSKKELYLDFKDHQSYHPESYSDLPINIRKYWNQRYILFSKYDDGIFLDKESWYSVTPEPIALHVAKRCKNKVVIDAFCGSGGNTIQFALHCDKVFAIEIDPIKIKLAQRNAEIYNVQHKIEFINADYTQIAHKLKADIVYLSPPWGGVEYLKSSIFDLSMLAPIHGKDLFDLSFRITPNIIYFLPKNIDPKEIVQLSHKNFFEIELNYILNQLKGVTVYFNGCAKLDQIL